MLDNRIREWELMGMRELRYDLYIMHSWKAKDEKQGRIYNEQRQYNMLDRIQWKLKQKVEL